VPKKTNTVPKTTKTVPETTKSKCRKKVPKQVATAKTYKKGEKVLIKVDDDIPGKFNTRWKGPYTVLEQKSDENYKLLTPKGKEYVTHVDRMKKCNSEKQSRTTNLAGETAVVTKANEIATTSTTSAARSDALVTATNSQPNPADLMATEKRVDKTVTDATTTVTEAQTRKLAQSIRHRYSSD
jgi:ribosomal protein L21E